VIGAGADPFDGRRSRCYLQRHRRGGGRIVRRICWREGNFECVRSAGGMVYRHFPVAHCQRGSGTDIIDAALDAMPN
jgi:hypothetical protein